MTVTYVRSGGGRGGVPEGEWLEIDDGGFRAWRQVAEVAVGHFAGELTGDERGRLDAALRACDSGEAPTAPVARPGATLVSVDLPGRSVSYGSGTPPAGAWGELDRVLNELCDAVTDRPRAAISIGLDDDGGGFRLDHVGPEPIDVDLSSGSFVAVVWEGWYHEVGRLEGPLTTDAATTATASTDEGWALSVPLAALDVGEGQVVHVTARFSLVVGDDAAAVEVAYVPALTPPA